MASIYLRGRVWWISYYEHGKKFDQSLKTRDKTVAKFKKNEIENKITKGESFSVQKDVPAKFVFDLFIKRCSSTAKPATVRYYEDIINPFLNAIPQGISIARITPPMIDQYIDAKSSSGKISAGMIWHIVKALKTFFNFSKKERFLSETPELRKKPRLPKRPPERWTSEEIKRILEFTEGNLAGEVIRFNLYVGLRPAEIVRLRWSDIDQRSDVLTVREAKDGEFRLINLHPEALEILGRLRQDGQGGPNQVFPGWSFDVMDYQARRIKKALNLGHIKRFWYAIRHTFATTYYEKTRDLRGLQEILGHSKIEMTTVYVNPNEEHRREQIRKLTY